MPAAHGAALPAGVVVVPAPERPDVVVLMIDTRTRQVTYASPPALALTGGRAELPCPPGAWSRAAGLAPVPGTAPGADPVQHVADGGVVSGRHVVLTGPGGAPRAFWVTGSPLVSGQGSSGRAMLVFLPAGPVPGPDGAAPRPDAGSAQATAAGAAALLSDGALTARALLASSISFTISDPRQEDDPLIWVNPAFERTTGYAADAVVGRNCRFLQGPDTDRVEVARIRAALVAGEPVASELLNYRADGTPFWNALAISPVLDGTGAVSHFVGVQGDVTARVLAGIEHDRLLAAERDARAAAEHARARLALIEHVGSVLSGTLDSEEALQRVVAAVVPQLGDFCAVDLLPPADGTGGADGTERPRRVAVAHRDPGRAHLYRQLARHDRWTPETSPLARMLATGRSVLVPLLTEAGLRERAGGDPTALHLLRALDAGSGAVVPLRARGRIIAALSIARTSDHPHPFGPDDLALAESLAARAALAVDNARLFEAEAAQRRRADALSAAGAALAASLRGADVVDVLLERVVPAFGDWAFVHVTPGGPPSLRPPGAGAGLHPVASRHADVQLERACAELLRDWPAGRGRPGTGTAWSAGTGQLLADVPAALDADPQVPAAVRESLRRVGVTSAMSVPLTARGQTVGTLTVCRHGGAPFTPEDLRFLDDLGRRGALALENARLYEIQRVVALELQRSLLPDRLPAVPQLDVAGRYLAGAAGTEVGGDWYDVVPLPDGRVSVAVGDVMGRGVRAAAVMGQLRSALRSYAVEGASPAQVLERMAAFTRVMEGEHLVTCLTGRYDPATGVLELASAGHPAPLLLRAGGGAALVGVEPGLPLGVPAATAAAGGAAYPVTRIVLTPGSGLMLYTDGLVEDRDVPVGEGMDRLESGMATVLPSSADEICDVALRLMGRLDSHDDDTAVLALRVPDATGPAPGPDGVRRLALLDAGPPAAGAARDLVCEALTGPLEGLRDAATLLVSELVANALRHGGGPRELVVTVAGAGVTVSVSDGSPAPPLQRDRSSAPVDALPENGRGLMLVAALADEWGWEAEPGGKRVWFRLRARPAGA